MNWSSKWLVTVLFGLKTDASSAAYRQDEAVDTEVLPVKRRRDRIRAALAALAASTFAVELVLALSLPARSQDNDVQTAVFSANPSGQMESIFLNGTFLDLSNPFFQSLGTNGRSCATCHVPSLDWTIIPARAQAVFAATDGLDPLFTPVDGANSPNADRSTVAARQAASSMLLTKGLIRVGIGIPANAEFTLDSCDDPYGYASANELSLFRRPLPATNLRFLTSVMFDGRESMLPDTFPISSDLSDAENLSNLVADLKHQALDATMGHGQAAVPPTDSQLSQIVAFEMSTATAQAASVGPGALTADGALGGPQNLANQLFYVTINDVGGLDHFGLAFSPSAMTLYSAWLNSSNPYRSQLARGEVIFNTKPMGPTSTRTCTSCHDAPNVGNRSVDVASNIGTSDASRRTPDMPLYTLKNIATGETVQTTDPGRALITGKWKDIGKFKTPVLRGLAGRAPYFHNGMATTLGDVVDFYDSRFKIGYTGQEKADLVAFLGSL